MATLDPFEGQLSQPRKEGHSETVQNVLLITPAFVKKGWFYLVQYLTGKKWIGLYLLPYLLESRLLVNEALVFFDQVTLIYLYMHLIEHVFCFSYVSCVILTQKQLTT